MQVLTRGFLLYFDRSELQFVGQETFMTELRFVWPLNVTGHYFRALNSWPSYLHKKHKKIGIYKMAKPNTKKRYFNYKRENSQPNTSYTWKKQINSVYPKKVNSGPAWTRTICNKLALSKSIMAKAGQNIFKFKPLSAGHKDGTVTSQRLFRKHNNAFTDIRPFTCNLRSSKKNFHLSQRPESRQKFLSLRGLTEWRTVTTGVLLSDSPHGQIGQKEMSMVI